MVSIRIYKKETTCQSVIAPEFQMICGQNGSLGTGAYGTTQYSTTQYSTTQYSTVQCVLCKGMLPAEDGDDVFMSHLRHQHRVFANQLLLLSASYLDEEAIKKTTDYITSLISGKTVAHSVHDHLEPSEDDPDVIIIDDLPENIENKVEPITNIDVGNEEVVITDTPEESFDVADIENDLLCEDDPSDSDHTNLKPSNTQQDCDGDSPSKTRDVRLDGRSEETIIRGNPVYVENDHSYTKNCSAKLYDSLISKFGPLSPQPKWKKVKKEANLKTQNNEETRHQRKGGSKKTKIKLSEAELKASVLQYKCKRKEEKKKKKASSHDQHGGLISEAEVKKSPDENSDSLYAKSVTMKEELRRTKREIQMEYCLEECGPNKTFTSEYSKNYHLRTKHSLMRTFLCTQCPRKFKQQFELEIHLEKKHKPKPKSCPFCSYYHENASYVASHIKGTHEDHPVTCAVCGEVKKNKQTLKKHQRVHKKVECPECGIELNQWTLKQHLVAKHGNEEFKSVTCDYCGKGFASKHGLRDHRMIHEDARPFPCRFENCDFSSKTSGNRKKHEIGKHGAGKRTLKKTVS